ncbi:MAG TPA: DHH family phosphoesterase [Oscillospiraceae bacterium]|nr:DHH family phosphoesterase [Oscillospiraceae bacterium]
MKKRLGFMGPALLTLFLLACGFAAVTAFYDWAAFATELVITAVVGALIALRVFRSRKEARLFLEAVAAKLSSPDRTALEAFPLPVLVTDKKGVVLWYSQNFQKTVPSENELFGTDIGDLSPVLTEDSPFLDSRMAAIGDRHYEVFRSEDPGAGLVFHYFIDRTEEKRIGKLYKDTHPAVLMIVMDNLEDLFANCKESERSRIMGEVESMFEQFALSTSSMLKKADGNRFIAVMEEQHLAKLIAERFTILDKARAIVTSDGLPVTLSIGVGRGYSTLPELQTASSQALEMSLGRGGDQATVRDLSGYEFYGGFAKGVEKRTKVKTRIVAAALVDLIGSSENILVMGHRSGDLDCVGAAIGMAGAVRLMGKPVRIVLNRKTCLAMPLVHRYEKNGDLGLFVPPEEALDKIGPDTLLIIVDTHVRHILESPEVYSACRNVVVIDHHRRMLGNIDNAVIFYHEPHSSSTCEMVTELLQYFPDACRPTKPEAEALLSGIMLDTRSFTVRAGARCFEAAAYLRRQGADPVAVKLLFSGTLEEYRERSEVVAGAELYRGCAVAIAKPYPDVALVAPQAADELLTIEGANASFVLFSTGDGTSISGRSLGAMNVQVILEALGGGGHQTMAGAQMKDILPEEALSALYQSIDDYYDNASGHAEGAEPAAPPDGPRP